MHWIALQPQPQPEPAGPAGLADVWTALGWWALQFTPQVVRLDDAVLLEVSASERLWGGRARLRHLLLESKQAPALVQHAEGATSLIAKARLLPGLAHTPASELPLAALAAAGPHLATLAALGCTRWGQLRALPRAGVARRFGAPLLQALDQACGQGPDRYPWLLLPEVFEASLELAAQVETAPALLFGARRLLEQLQFWLQLRQRAVLALVLRWTMDPRRDTATQGELLLRCAEPTLDTLHLQRLLAEHLARTTLPAPALALQLRTVETVPRSGHSASLLPEAQRPGDSLHQLLERLGARLGPAQLLQLQPQADHRPERMQRWQAVSNATVLVANEPSTARAGALNHSQDQALYPSWLLATPQRLAVRQGCPHYPDRLTLLAGPQRLETGWWEAQPSALRDYYVARSSVSGLLWVYRERLDQPQAGAGLAPRWYLHGVFG
jgi:protein ImuB